MKWVGYIDPTWEPVENVADTEALDNYEATYGPIADPSPSNRQPEEEGNNVRG